jgi:HEAT repeat protein
MNYESGFKDFGHYSAVRQLLKSLPIRMGIVLLIALAQPLSSQSVNGNLSEEAKETIPNLLSRMHSEDPIVRLQLVDELVVDEVNESDSDVPQSSLRYDLSSDDYSIILQHALMDLANRLSDKERARILWKVEFISKTHKLVAVDGAVAEFAKCQSDRISKRAIEILVEMKSHLAVPYLLPRLQSKDAYGALLKLVTVGAVEAVPEIQKLLDYSDENAQHWAVWALFNLDARDCRDIIYRSLVKDRMWRDVDPYTLAVLTKWKDARAFPIVMKWLLDDSLGVRDPMMSRLLEIEAKPIEDPVIAFLSIGQAVANDTGTDANIKLGAIRLLGQLKSRKAIPLLRKMTSEKYKGLSGCAAEQLGILEAKEAIPELLTMLDRGDDFLWYSATLALARIGSPATAGRVVSELERKKSNSHHVEVLDNLAKVSAPNTYKTLMLENAELSQVPSVPVERYLSHVADVSGIIVSISETVRKEDKDRVVGGSDMFPSGIRSIRRAIAVLNYDGYNYAIFVEDQHVHVLTIEEAYAKWKSWLQSYEAK